MRIGAVLDLRDQMSSKLRTAGSNVRRFTDDTRNGMRHMDRFAGSIARTGAGVVKWFGDRASRLVKNFFTSLKISAAIGVAAASAFFAKTINDAMSFETTLRNTTALIRGAGATSGEADVMFKQFGEGILEMAPRLARAPKDIADAMYEVVSAGFEGADALKVIEAAAKGASAGFTSTDVVVKGLVGTLNAYGYGSDQAKRITDVMFQAVNVGSLSFEDFSQNIGDVVGMAATAKIPIEEVGAAIAMMTKRGIVPAEAFTSLNRFLMSIVAPSPQVKEAADTIFGKDNDWNAKGLALGGMSGMLKMLTSVLKPTNEQMKLLQSSSDEVADNAAASIAGDKIEVLSSLFGDIRGLRGALQLASQEGYTFNDAMDDMKGSVGSVDKAFDEQEKTADRAKKRISAYFDVIRLQLASGLLPGMADAFKGVGDWIDANIINNPEYANATGMDKVKALGRIMWTAVTGWWEDNKNEVTNKIDAAFEWLGDTALPKAVEWGLAIGKEVVPAIFKGITGSAEGSLLLALFAGSKALSLPGAMTRGGGAAGGGAAAGGGLLGGGMLSSIGQITLTAGVIYLAADAVYEQYKKTRAEVVGAQRDMAAEAARASLPDLFEGLKQARSDSASEKAAERLYTGSTSEDVVSRAIASNITKETDRAIGERDVKSLSTMLDTLHENRGILSKDDFLKFTGQVLGAQAQIAQDAGFLHEQPGRIHELTQNYATDPKARAELQGLADTAQDLFSVQQQVVQWYGETNGSLERTAALLHNIAPQWEGMLGQLIYFFDTTSGFLSNAAALVNIYNPNAPRTTPVSGSGGITGIITGTLGVQDIAPPAKAVSIPRGPGMGLAPPGGVSGRQGMALGGRGTVSKPTWFMAGDSGHEDYEFTPHRSGPGRGRGSTVTVQGPLIGEAHIANDLDIEEVADKLVDALEAREVNT